MARAIKTGEKKRVEKIELTADQAQTYGLETEGVYMFEYNDKEKIFNIYDVLGNLVKANLPISSESIEKKEDL